MLAWTRVFIVALKGKEVHVWAPLFFFSWARLFFFYWYSLCGLHFKSKPPASSDGLDGKHKCKPELNMVTPILSCE